MEVEIISKEFIKPSSPTPLHRKTHKLSLLDQYIPPIYIPLILYYPFISNQQDPNLSKTDIVSRRLQLLKQSLSEVLSLFYPFAGTIKDKLSIDCNDDGVPFVEARTESSVPPLCEFLNTTELDLSLLSKFVPSESTWSPQPITGAHVASIQVTVFSCGSFVIGVSVSHVISDGIALSTFLKCWATIARNKIHESCYDIKNAPISRIHSSDIVTISKENYNNIEKIPCLYNIDPNFDASTLFRPYDAFPEEKTLMATIFPFFKTGRLSTKRLVFDASAITKLKSKAKNLHVENPTRVEVVSALISKSIRATVKVNSGFYKSTFLTHAINLRRRAVPQLPEQSMGNHLWLAATRIINDDETTEFQHLICQIRESIRKIDGEFVKKLQGDEGFVNLIESVTDVACNVYAGMEDCVGFTSWCKFGYYEIDFGWGTPTWVSCIGSKDSKTAPYKNSIVLMDTRSGDGIEVWVYLGKEDMDVLQHDNELLAFALMDPSPLRR